MHVKAAEQHADLKAEVDSLKLVLEQRLQPKASEELPTEPWIQNDAGRVVYTIKTTTHTFCGCPGSTARTAILREGTDQSDRMWTTCVRCEGLLL